MSDNGLCRKCKQPMPEPGQYANSYTVVAMENGCCCFGCLIGLETTDGAYGLLAAYQKRMEKVNHD